MKPCTCTSICRGVARLGDGTVCAADQRRQGNGSLPYSVVARIAEEAIDLYQRRLDHGESQDDARVNASHELMCAAQGGHEFASNTTPDLDEVDLRR